MGSPWDSRENGNEKHVSIKMEIISVGLGMSQKIYGSKITISVRFQVVNSV